MGLAGSAITDQNDRLGAFDIATLSQFVDFGGDAVVIDLRQSEAFLCEISQ
jgi:hypothetical protein